MIFPSDMIKPEGVLFHFKESNQAIIMYLIYLETTIFPLRDFWFAVTV